VELNLLDNLKEQNMLDGLVFVYMLNDLVFTFVIHSLTHQDLSKFNPYILKIISNDPRMLLKLVLMLLIHLNQSSYSTSQLNHSRKFLKFKY